MVSPTTLHHCSRKLGYIIEIHIAKPSRIRPVTGEEGLCACTGPGCCGRTVPIPRDGFVVNLGGSEAASLLGRFSVGKAVDYRVDLGEGWAGVQELVQAGPRLLTAGQMTIDFAAEGFTEEKITKLAWTRSAIGITRDNILLLAVADAATVRDMATFMADLGAVDALCMDSGASSGLWFQGSQVWKPGRELANVLAFVPE